MRRQEKAEPCPPLRDHCGETTTPYHILTHCSETTTMGPPPLTTALPYRSETTAVSPPPPTTALPHHSETTTPYHRLTHRSETTAVSPPPLTTALSQMTDIRSSVPLVPSGIRVKLSFPTAFWAVLKVQWALPVTWRSPLQGTHSLRSSLNIFFSRIQTLKVFKTVILPPGDRKFRRHGLTLKLQ